MKRVAAALCVLMLSTGCAVGPNYKRPVYNTPPAFRGDQTPAATPGQTSFGDLKWFELFKDEKLQALIKEALAANYDVRIAAQRVLAARQQVTMARAPLFPSVDGGGSLSKQRLTSALNQGIIGGSVQWELDLWGKIRRETEAARAQYLAQEEVRKGVLQTLVTDVAAAYLSLLELDRELEVAKQSLSARQTSLRLVQARLDGGVSNVVEVDQAATLVYTAAATIADIEREMEQDENLISTLLGRNPGPIERTSHLMDQKLPVEVPAGLPSALLERRPDIRQAEQYLVAANAMVGVAKAAFFPSITLTGTGGYQNFELSSLFKTDGTFYGYGGQLNLPIFNAGSLWANFKASKAQREAAILMYQQSVQHAFQDVSDSLVGYRKINERLVQDKGLAMTLRHQRDMSESRYEGGVTSYLEVLDTDRQYLDAELNYSQSYDAELSSVIHLYKALGGGWQ
jgi:multidrug efflux system outer membrane protein